MQLQRKKDAFALEGKYGKMGIVVSHPFRKERGKDGAPSVSEKNASGAKSPAYQPTIEQFLAVGEARYALASDGLLQREPGGEWRRILSGGGSQLADRDVTIELSDEATAPGAPNFTGAFVGVACQDLSGAAQPADFDYFEYRERDYSRQV